MNSVPAVELDSVSYAYRSNWLLQRVSSIQEVSLTVPAGEAFGFLGHNGAGKTTTIKCILDLVRPQHGTVRIFGEESKGVQSRCGVGYVPEQPYFYDHLTVAEIMDLYATLHGVESSQKASAINEALERVHMTARLRSKMRSLSKGLTQRVAMAQAIVAKPKLLILDEPFSGLDPLGRKEFADLIRSFKEEGSTIFMSSHVLSDVEQICDRVSIMRKGKIEGVYDLSEIEMLVHGHYELVIRQPSETLLESLPKAYETVCHEQVYRLCYPDSAVAHTALEILVQNDMQVLSFGFVHGGLEELFVKLVSIEEELDD